MVSPREEEREERVRGVGRDLKFEHSNLSRSGRNLRGLKLRGWLLMGIKL